ncbi:response regulator [Ectothiorhodospiraceae bacterium BW-2]|nr:response regulator [Ectothiorhodospiraceae bacterium BW-2]
MTKLKPLHIFIIDDASSTRETLQLVLLNIFRENYPQWLVKIHQAESFAEARRHLLFQQAHITFLDINLPDGNGLQFMSELKESHPKMGVIIISGDATVENVKAAMSYGACSFILKPFKLIKVKDSIEHCFKKYNF